MEDPELEKLARDYTRAEAKANDLRPRLYARIYAYQQKHGERRGWQTELVKATGLTRERIRQIIAAEEKRRKEHPGPTPGDS
jgi:ribosomal protein L13E